MYHVEMCVGVYELLGRVLPAPINVKAQKVHEILVSVVRVANVLNVEMEFPITTDWRSVASLITVRGSGSVSIALSRLVCEAARIVREIELELEDDARTLIVDE